MRRGKIWVVDRMLCDCGHVTPLLSLHTFMCEIRMTVPAPSWVREKQIELNPRKCYDCSEVLCICSQPFPVWGLLYLRSMFAHIAGGSMETSVATRRLLVCGRLAFKSNFCHRLTRSCFWDEMYWTWINEGTECIDLAGTLSKNSRLWD